MILSNGNNEFENNVYSFWKWSAPVLQTHDEIISKLDELKLEGKIVKNIRCVGMAYNWRDDEIADSVYCALKAMTPKQRRAVPNEKAFLPEGVYLLRYVEIDEPLLIEFEDGDVFAVDYSDGSCVRMDMNTIPKDIRFGTNTPTVHTDRLFSDVIGKEIIAVEVVTSTAMPDFTGAHGMELEEQSSYITGFRFLYSCGSSTYAQGALEFTSSMDYGHVSLKDFRGDWLKIHAPDVKAVVEGFIGPEILNAQDEIEWDEI